MTLLRNFLPKTLLFCLFFSLAIFALVEREGGTAADPLTPEERAFVTAHGSILYAPDPLFPPFEFIDSSRVGRGITPDLLTIMGRKLGVEFRTVAYPTWSDVLEAVKQGKVDLLGTLTRTPDREDFLLFSTPYLSVPYVLFARQDDSDLKTIDDMVSRRLGVVRNYGINAWLSIEYPNLRPVAVTDTATGLTMVATGQLDAMLEALPVGNYIVRDRGLTNVRIVPRRIYALPQYFGVRKGEPLLLSIVQKGLDSLTETERSEVFLRWTGQDFTIAPPAISPVVRNVLLILIAAAVLSGVWIVALRRSVRRATQSLKGSEERFRVLSEQSPLGMALIDPQGRYEYVNPAFVSIFGYTLPEVPTGADWFRVAFPDPEARKEVIRAWKEDLARTGVREARPRNYDVTCKDGTKKSILFRPVSLSSGRQFVITEDVTRHRVLQAQLQQAMKIEAVGRLAGGIAHDFNNLLTVITGYGDLVLSKLGEKSPLYKDVEEIKRAGERAAALTGQLLAFSRRQVLQPKVLDLNEVVSGIERMLRRLLPENVEFRTVLGTGLRRVKADPGQIEQVVMNLAVNARDAMPGGGMLTVETSNVFLDEGYSQGHFPMRPGDFVQLAISDTGVGMDDETRSRIFEPFFTTKESGKGTGLGLATVYGIVKQSGGFIWVYSEPGKGSSFKIYLPRTEEREEVPDKAVSPDEDLRGEKTILLVEDDKPIRMLAIQILGEYGYTSLSAGDGEEALRIAGAYDGEISLLLADVVMPKMGGAELFKQLRQLRPGIKVLYVSGYTSDAIVHQGMLDPGIAFLQKPYSPISLARKVKEVLETQESI